MDNKYNLNYLSADVQPMSVEKPSAYRLWKTVNEYLGSATMFFSFSEQSKYTYEDFVAYIGCEATNYFFDTKNNERTYTWIAQDDNSYSLCVWFKQKGETWNLYLIPPQ